MTERNCLVEGCTAYALFGYRPSDDVPAKWACGDHQHLLVKEAPVSVSRWLRPQREASLSVDKLHRRHKASR